MNYKELAKLAGVSASTVSKALSGSEEISKETSKRIRALAIANGIDRPRYFREKNTITMAIVVPEIRSKFSSEVSDIVSRVLWDNKVIPKLYICGDPYVRYCKAVDNALADGCMGVVSLYKKQKFSYKTGIPILHVPYYKMICGAFSSDNLNSGVAKVIDELVSLGHTEIGYVGFKDSLVELEGFVKAMKAKGMVYKPEYVFTEAERINFKGKSVGESAVDFYLSGRSMPTAIVCAEDRLGVSLIHLFKERGVRVPQDISVVGVGNTMCAECKVNSLASVEIVIEDTIATLVRLFIRDIANKSEIPKTDYIVPQSKLIVRDSVGKPRKGRRRRLDV